jgi:hypothetical protein
MGPPTPYQASAVLFSPLQHKDDAMPAERQISLALQEGFVDDTVRISAGNRVIHQLEHIKTRTQIGLAQMLEIALSEGEDKVTVEIPAKGLEATLDLGASAATNWAVSVNPDQTKLDVVQSAVPFGYL